MDVTAVIFLYLVIQQFYLFIFTVEQKECDFITGEQIQIKYVLMQQNAV